MRAIRTFILLSILHSTTNCFDFQKDCIIVGPTDESLRTTLSTPFSKHQTSSQKPKYREIATGFINKHRVHLKRFHKIDESLTSMINQEIQIQSTLPKNQCYAEYLGCYYDSEEKLVYVASQLYDGDFSEESPVGKAFRQSGDLKLKLQTYIRLIDCVFDLHERKIMHNDLKPHNLVSKLDDLSSIRIIDFGFATFPEQSANGGTLSYLPPEYAQVKINIIDASGNECKFNRAPSIKRDSYSLGKTLAMIELGKEAVLGQSTYGHYPSNCFEINKTLRQMHRQLIKALETSIKSRSRSPLEIELHKRIRKIVWGIPEMRPNLPSIQYIFVHLYQDNFGLLGSRDELRLSSMLRNKHFIDNAQQKLNSLKI